jgi:hypothetical protein
MKAKKIETMLYRQGDVLFRRINNLPSGEQRKRENATVAEGEVTGHSHRLALEDRIAGEVVEIGNGLFVQVSDQGLRLGKSGVEFVHEEHLPITLPPGSYEVTIQREYSPDSIRNVID